MPAMKECPSCGTEVPEVAPRCKVCFHDFTEEPPPRSNGPLVLLAAFAMMAVIGAVILGWAVTLPTDMSAHVDHDSQSVVFVTKYRSGEETEAVPWSRIGMVEHVTTKNGGYEVNVVLLDGTRRLLAASESSLGGDAERYGEVMGKTVEYVNEHIVPGSNLTEQGAE